MTPTPAPEHSPLPWKQGTVARTVLGPSGERVFLITKNHPYIVEAVNNHDRLKKSQSELLEACKFALGYIRHVEGDSVPCEVLEKAIARSEAKS